MKKKVFQIFFVLFFIICIFFNNELLATDTYSASLSCSTADLFYIHSWGERDCIAGNSTIFENLDGTSTSLSSIPKIVLQSTDETETQWVYVEKRGDTYYFDVDITRLDFSKEYVFKVKSNNSNNTYGYQTLNVKDEFIAILELNTYITVKDNVITLSNTYSAPLSCSTASLFYIHSWGDRDCIAGTSTIFEDIDGTSTSLSSIPKIVLQSTDGTETQWVYVEKRGDTYYFDVDITRLDTSKEYVFKVKSNNSSNVNGYQTLNVKDTSLFVSSLITYITVKDNVITLSNTYSAPLSCSTASLYYNHSWGDRDCIAGTSTIFENLNGSNISLSSIPKIVLQSTDGTETQWVYVEKRGDTYYFDVDVTRLDISKEYVFKVKSSNSNNGYGYQTLNVSNGSIAFPDLNIYVTIENNTISLSNNYTATFSFESANLYFIQNDNGNVYLAGTASLYEKLDSTTILELPTLPTIQLKSSDWTYSKKGYVEKVGTNKYFFSFLLDDLDLSKTYYITATNNNTNNLSTTKQVHVWVNSLYNNSTTLWMSSSLSYLTFYEKVVTGIYGMSGLKVIGDSRGTDLTYYKIGHGENVLFATFAIHGYEDLWAGDGAELTYIAEEFVKKLSSSTDSQIMDKWTIYVFPQCNPDGVNYGYTNNGVGRCTVTGVNGHGVDMNRCWSSGFVATYTNRNYTGSQAFGAYEAQYLRDFMLENKSKTGQTILIDLHGWTTQLIGDRGICLNYFGPQFYGSYSNSLSKYTSSYGSGYMINWARNYLGNSNGVAARSALIELPSAGISSHTSVVNANYAGKYYNAVVNMLKGIV